MRENCEYPARTNNLISVSEPKYSSQVHNNTGRKGITILHSNTTFTQARNNIGSSSKIGRKADLYQIVDTIQITLTRELIGKGVSYVEFIIPWYLSQ